MLLLRKMGYYYSKTSNKTIFNLKKFEENETFNGKILARLSKEKFSNVHLKPHVLTQF
jgi:hypothetical protein